MASKVSQVTDILRGAHVMGDTLVWHDAKACVNAMRRVGRDRQFREIRQVTKNYRVIVSMTPEGIRIFRPDNKAELILLN